MQPRSIAYRRKIAKAWPDVCYHPCRSVALSEGVRMKFDRLWLLAAGLAFVLSLPGWSEAKRKIIIDQDGAGPGGTDQQSMLLVIQSPATEVLGITLVTGDQWLKAETAHTLRMLELVGRTDIPVVPGAENPLVRGKQETELEE